jgi:hypothetical protein
VRGTRIIESLRLRRRDVRPLGLAFGQAAHRGLPRELLGRGAFRQGGLGHGVEEVRAFLGGLGQEEVAVAPELAFGREIRVDLEQLGPPLLQLGGAAQLGVDQRVPEACVIVVVIDRLGGGRCPLEPADVEIDVALPPAVAVDPGRVSRTARSTSSTPRAVWPPIGRSTAPSSDMSLTSRCAMSATRCTSLHQRRISLPYR